MGKKPIMGRRGCGGHSQNAGKESAIYELMPSSEYFSGKISPFCEEE
jgi:hypothetical protein